MKHYIPIILILLLSACRADCYDPTDIGDGFYYEPHYKEVIYDYKPESGSDGFGPYKTAMAGVNACRVIDNYILMRQKLDTVGNDTYNLLLSLRETQANAQWKDLKAIYTHGFDNTYYIIYDKKTHIKYGPYIYDELVEKCDSLGIAIF